MFHNSFSISQSRQLQVYNTHDTTHIAEPCLLRPGILAKKKMAKRFIWSAGAKLVAVSTTLLGGAGAASIATSEDPSRTLKLYTAVPLRLVRDAVTAASIVFGMFPLPIYSCVAIRV